MITFTFFLYSNLNFLLFPFFIILFFEFIIEGKTCNADLVFLNYFPCEMEFFIDENDVYTYIVLDIRSFFFFVLFFILFFPSRHEHEMNYSL